MLEVFLKALKSLSLHGDLPVVIISIDTEHKLCFCHQNSTCIVLVFVMTLSHLFHAPVYLKNSSLRLCIVFFYSEPVLPLARLQRYAKKCDYNAWGYPLPKVWGTSCAKSTIPKSLKLWLCFVNGLYCLLCFLVMDSAQWAFHHPINSINSFSLEGKLSFASMSPSRFNQLSGLQ